MASASRRSAEVLRRFDAGFGRLLSALTRSDVTVLVTADHGFVDAPADERIDLDDHPLLAATLARPCAASAAPRIATSVPARRAPSRTTCATSWRERALLFDSRALIQAGWFGPGEPHPRLQSRIGDYVLLMQAGATIKDWMPGERRHALIGVHGGASADEMLVPRGGRAMTRTSAIPHRGRGECVARYHGMSHSRRAQCVP